MLFLLLLLYLLIFLLFLSLLVLLLSLQANQYFDITSVKYRIMITLTIHMIHTKRFKTK